MPPDTRRRSGGLSTEPRDSGGLSLRLHPYNIVYIAVLSAIVIGGTLYSMIYTTHHYNVILSDPMGALARAQAQQRAGQAHQSGMAQLNELWDASRNMPNMPGTFLASRQNWINRIFIKMAWLWTTAAFLLQAVTLRRVGTVSSADAKVFPEQGPATATGKASEADKLARRKNGKAQKAEPTLSTAPSPGDASVQQNTVEIMATASLVRYIAATMIWVLFARWFFGPSLMERVRGLSGGVCSPTDKYKGTQSGTSSAALSRLRASLPDRVDAGHCYSGGSMLSSETHPHAFAQAGLSEAERQSIGVRAGWQGGHDISGHTFVLIISALYLLEELTPFLPHLVAPRWQSYIAQIIPQRYWAPRSPFIASGAVTHERARVNQLVAGTILALVGIWTLSLLVTSVFFHTPQEKISGLLLALACSRLIPKGG